VDADVRERRNRKWAKAVELAKRWIDNDDVERRACLVPQRRLRASNPAECCAVIGFERDSGTTAADSEAWVGAGFNLAVQF
jgi:hypothetical protein